MSEAPYKLSEGLWLEKAGLLIPWFSSLGEINGLGGSRLPEKGKASQLFWDNESVLSGLAVAIQAFPRGAGTFHLTRRGTTFSSAQEEYPATLSELTKRFGQPHETKTENSYPVNRWRWEDICLTLTMGERFMDYVALSVSKGVTK